ncbi:Fructosamine kinase-domain-containing protein [Nemania sp. FL0031]|nr:Fructosamine kinase-domain-containing protein [Nemania sp. FL0031]
MPKQPEGLEHIEGDYPMDVAILRLLPPSFKLISVHKYDYSAISITGCLHGEFPDGSRKKYFIKCATGEDGRNMFEGEHESLTLISKICPNLVPRPLGWGEYREPTSPGSSIYFLVEDFVTIPTTRPLPSPELLAARLAQLHRQGKSPTGKFGFPVVTCDGVFPHPVEWQDDWAAFFAELLRSRVNMDVKASGPWPEMERAAEQVITKVIPKLLGSLQWNGRPIEPSLIHGDLWEGNVTVNASGEPVLYDAGSYYAHNEMELGPWRVVFSPRLGKPAYRDAYMKQYPPAEPAGEWDDRNRLYSIKSNLNYATTHKDVTREIAYNDMCYLCEKYAPLATIDKYDPELDPTVMTVRPLPSKYKTPELPSK